MNRIGLLSFRRGVVVGLLSVGVGAVGLSVGSGVAIAQANKPLAANSPGAGAPPKTEPAAKPATPPATPPKQEAAGGPKTEPAAKPATPPATPPNRKRLPVPIPNQPRSLQLRLQLLPNRKWLAVLQNKQL